MGRVVAYSYLDIEFDLDSVTIRSSSKSRTAPFDDSILDRSLDLDFENHAIRRDLSISHSAPAKPSRQTRPLEEIGSDLFESLFTSSTRVLLDEELDRIEGVRDRGVCVRLRFDLSDQRSAQIAALPWELLYHPEKKFFLNLSGSTSVIRFLENSESAPEKGEIPQRIKILLFVSAPTDLAELRLPEETKNIQSSWTQDNVEIDIVDMESLSAGSDLGEALRDRLRQSEYHVLHYMGHGKEADSDGEGSLVLEDENRLSLLVGGRHFASWLSNSSISLVVLNACGTGQRQSASSDRSYDHVASSLIQSGIPTVLAMRHAIPDREAIVFSRVFYQGLAKGKPIEAALSESRHEISCINPESAAWATPTLYTRTTKKFRPPPRIEVFLERAWTVLGLATSAFLAIIFLRAVSAPVPALIDLRDLVNADVASLFGMLVGAPLILILFAILYLYRREIESVRPTQESSIWERFAGRLPIIFGARVYGRRRIYVGYQMTSFFLLAILPVLSQIFFFIEFLKGQVWFRKSSINPEGHKLFSQGIDHFLKYVPPIEALEDWYRFGSPDKKAWSYNWVTFFPFWGAWGLLILEVLILVVCCRFALSTAKNRGED